MATSLLISDVHTHSDVGRLVTEGLIEAAKTGRTLRDVHIWGPTVPQFRCILLDVGMSAENCDYACPHIWILGWAKPRTSFEEGRLKLSRAADRDPPPDK
jgi:hypothetical protein